tara:strand:- start:3167 stop:3808 length:642 start_codon:yes stop_codon:yes gene_type:complete
MNTTTQEKYEEALKWTQTLLQIETRKEAQEAVRCFQHGRKIIEKKEKPFLLKVKKAFAKHKEACANLKSEVDKLKEEQDKLKEALVAWYSREKEKSDVRRLDAERVKVDDESALLVQKWKDEMLALEEMGKVEEALLLRENLSSMVEEERMSLEGARFDEFWSFEIVDESLIPAQYLQPDEKAIQKAVSSMRGVTSIPGVRSVRKFRSVISKG